MREKLQALWIRYKDILLYLFFGGLTTVVGVGSYWLLTRFAGMDYVTGNVISWVISVTFAFITNKLFVFESRSRAAKTLTWELLTFYGGRLFSLGAETLLLWVGIDLLHWYDMLVKIIANVVVILLNYFISKLLVFRK